MPQKPSPKRGEEKPEWFNFLPAAELTKRLNKYMLDVANHKGKVLNGLKSKIGQMALKEWLENHEKDLDLF
jgi:hypothetical protein